VAVAAFLEGRCGFGALADAVARVLEATPVEPIDTLDAVRAADPRARRATHRHLSRLAPC
jgi:1-deoxy-D-xylulose-5-phosphate reductoisomerase